ncbi:MAG: hypothetical protein QM674_10260 [Burkholderiaceae bacterium]
MLLEFSAKKGLDVEWSAPQAKAQALDELVLQIESLQTWVRGKLAGQMNKRAMSRSI